MFGQTLARYRGERYQGSSLSCPDTGELPEQNGDREFYCVSRMMASAGALDAVAAQRQKRHETPCAARELVRPTPRAYTDGNDLSLEGMVNAVAHCGQRAERPQMAVGSETWNLGISARLPERAERGDTGVERGPRLDDAMSPPDAFSAGPERSTSMRWSRPGSPAHTDGESEAADEDHDGAAPKRAVSDRQRVARAGRRVARVADRRPARPGCVDRGIAERLVLSPTTVYSHVYRVLHKLGVHSRWEAVAAAQRLRQQEASIESLGHSLTKRTRW